MRFFLLSLCSYLLYVIVKYRKSLYMLQQNSYDINRRYIKWVFRNYHKTLITEDLLFSLSVGLYFVIPYQFFMVIVAIFYLFLFYLELRKIKKEQHKIPFKITSRIKRLIFTILILFVVILVVIGFNFLYKDLLWYYLIIVGFTYLSFIITWIVNIINYPVERIVYHHYKRMALTKIKKMDDLIIIGVTGSYGKTSCKNILNDILGMKYNSFATPKSFNTPLGLMNAINNHLDKFDETFIAEMGARAKGHIKELCNFIKPRYGIITKIGVAHLETFKTEENIINEKMVLIESLPKDGVGVLNKDDLKQANYNLKNNCQILWIGIDSEDVDVRASNIKVTSEGMTFDVTFRDINKTYTFSTSLLGRFNIYNILSAVALGYYLGIKIEDLILAVKRLMSTEHRLEVKKMNGITIIDDAFNSNPEGSKAALDVLSLMKGKKIIVTPGMVDLGKKQEELNRKFGNYIANVCDEVILVGELQTKPIYEGLIEKGYDQKHIHIINDVKKAFVLMQQLKEKETYVLLENDLPDLFIGRK